MPVTGKSGSFLISTVLVVAGGGFGGMATLVVPHLLPHSLPPRLDRPSTTIDANQSATPVALPVDLAAMNLEERLARLEELERQDAGATKSLPTPSEVFAQATKPELHDYYDAKHKEILDRFDREGVDPLWSRRAESSFTSDLSASASAKKYSVVAVECHTTMCTANLEWPTFADARANYARVAGLHYTMNCGRDFYVPEPRDPADDGKPYVVTAIFDCEDSRAEN